MLDAGCWMLDGSWMLDAGVRGLWGALTDTRKHNQCVDFGCTLPGRKLIRTRQKSLSKQFEFSCKPRPLLPSSTDARYSPNRDAPSPRSQRPVPAPVIVSPVHPSYTAASSTVNPRIRKPALTCSRNTPVVHPHLNCLTDIWNGSVGPANADGRHDALMSWLPNVSAPCLRPRLHKKTGAPKFSLTSRMYLKPFTVPCRGAWRARGHCLCAC